MDSSTDVLVETVRARRNAVDNDLELLRLRTRAADPRQMAARWGSMAVPIVVGAAAVWLALRGRRSAGSLRDVLVQSLADLRRAEHQLAATLERMGRAASNPDLANLFARHAGTSHAHVERLDRVFKSIGARPRRGASATMAAVEQEAKGLLCRRAAADVRDASMIGLAQRAEHLEIAGYGTARTFAETLGHDQAAQLLEQTLDEEREMDRQLTLLAERFVNPQSAR